MNDFWHIPARVNRNNFVHKSLSCFAFNPAVGCEHGCRFCYVPAVSTGKGAIADKLREKGVADPDADWGDYVFVRPVVESALRSSIRAADKTPLADLNADGNRAVMLCTTTDPFQVVRHPDPEKRANLQRELERSVRTCLEIILKETTLNVRILTRSPLATKFFPLMLEFGDRLLFGMSIPTLDGRLAKVYEPKAPHPEQRLRTLVGAKKFGLRTFVAVAPTYPECTLDDIRETMKAVSYADPFTVFHEAINIRADNVERISLNAKAEGVALKTEVFSSPQA